MSKEKPAPSNPIPILVVYGLDEKDQPRAGSFFETDFNQAQKAAELMGLEAFVSEAHRLKPVLKHIAAGQAYASGWGFIPRIRRNYYDALISVIASLRPHPALGKDTGVFPATWSEIAKDSLVIAQADFAELGWWEAIVEKVDGEKLTMRWKGFPKDPAFQRHLSAVALIRPPQER
jgi:hypothetical protein